MGRTQRHPGLGKTSVKRSNKRRHGQGEELTAGRQEEREQKQRKRRCNEVQSLPRTDQDNVRRMDTDITFAHDYSPPSPSVSGIPPPGEEGNDISHEGGEYEVFHELAEDIERITGFKRYDDRLRGDRIERQTEAWELQMELLVTAFLKYRAADEGEGFPPQRPLPPTAPSPVPQSFTVKCIDAFSKRDVPIWISPGEEYLNQSLIAQGYIGCSPLQPVLAISIRTLELYRQTHRTAPHFGIEAQCKTLCHMHGVAYNTYLRTQFTAAFDAYLEITRRVDELVNAAAGFTSALSRIRYSCPCCFYRLEDEPPLKFSCMVSIDGNNSLKRLGSTIRISEDRLDTRQITSDRWLSAAEVDKFAKEKNVVQGTTKALQDSDIGIDEQSWEDEDEYQPGSLKCIDRWKNAGPDERKKMFALFDETGIFIASCRHRMVLAVCDMIKSGEASKYPLAVLDRLMDIAGPDMGCAYDIGCAFNATLHASSLRAKAIENRVSLMVGSFHGHAHNRSCQLRWHPLHIPGAGLSEGEGCEHVFSSSNNLARTTRHASRFHRHQAIEEHFRFWDDDKYANLSIFLRNHHQEALTLVQTLEAELDILKSELHLTDSDFEGYLAKERAYLDSLKAPSPEVLGKIQYVNAINELSKCRAAWHGARSDALSFVPLPRANVAHQATNLRLRVDAAYSKLQHAEELVSSFEQGLGIQERWTSESPEYIEYREQIVATDYSNALDELERLIVMRLFELAKLRSSGTGYKLRRYIGKALQRRSEAIRNALQRYNKQAALLNPPRPALTWKEVVDYSFLGEFDLLRLGRQDIRSELWAQPARREGTVKYFKLCRAKEELVRINVEIRRLRTFIRDESRHMANVISKLTSTDPDLASELRRQWAKRNSVNMIHMKRLNNLEHANPFTVVSEYGNALDTTIFPDVEDGLDLAPKPHVATDISVLAHVHGTVPNDQDCQPIDDETAIVEEAEAQLITMTDFMLSISD